MSRQSPRYYSPLWEQMKTDCSVSVQLQPLTMTPQQAEKVSKVFKRGISKEKYEDILYRDAFPNSQIKYTYNPTTYVLTMTLFPTGMADKLTIL